MVSKKDIRKHVLLNRNLLTVEEWEEKSRFITEKVTSHPFFLEANIIYCYVDYQKEAGTRAIIEKAWALGKEVRVPKVEGDEIIFYTIHSFADLEAGYKGIPEPKNDTNFPVDEGLVIVPGVAFDKARNRIGYGKGFYDRFLEKQCNLKTMAIAFEMQVLDAILAEENDQKPEVLITEEKVYV